MGSLDDLIRSLEPKKKPETPQQQESRLSALDKLKERKRPVYLDPGTGLSADQLEAQNKVMKAKAERTELITPPPGETFESAEVRHLARGREANDLYTNAKKLEFDNGEEPSPFRKQEIETSQRRATTSTDTLGIIAKARQNPGKYGADFDAVATNLQQGTNAIAEYRFERDEQLIQADKELTPEQRGSPFFQANLAANIESAIIDSIQTKYGRPFNEMVEHHDELKDVKTEIKRTVKPTEEDTFIGPPQPYAPLDAFSQQEPPMQSVQHGDMAGEEMLQEIKSITGTRQFNYIINRIGASLGAVEELTKQRTEKLEADDQRLLELYESLKMNYSNEQIEAMLKVVSPAAPPYRTMGSTSRAKS